MPLIIALTAKYLIFVSAILTAGLWLTLSKTLKLQFVVNFAVAGLLSIVLSQTIAHFYFDPRPFVVQHRTPLIPHVPDNGFPSDHTTLTMLMALVSLRYSRPAGIALIVMSLLIGMARIAALVHSPIDIAGSVAIAAVSVFVAGKVPLANRKPVNG